MLKQTILNSLHRAAGAKMVDFGGWDMPLHYGSQIEEHHHVRHDAGMFDVSHMRVVDLAGDGVQDWLRHLLANDVARLNVTGRALYSCMLNPQGGVIDDLIVYWVGEGRYRMVVNAGTTDKDLAWMREQANGRAIEICPREDLAMIAIQGPLAREKVWSALPGARAVSETLKPFHATWMGEWFIARTGYTGEDGFEIMLPTDKAGGFWQALVAAGVAPCGLGARDTLRLEAGMNLYGQDMDETTTPLETGLGWTVWLRDDRSFIGRAGLTEPTRKQVGLVLLDKGVMRSHSAVQTTQGVGEVTSGSFSPTLNRSIGLARVPAAVTVGDVVQIAVRDKLLNAKVVDYPFVRNGQPLVNV